MTTQTTLKELTDQLEALRARFAVEGKAAVHESLKDLFQKHPLLSEIHWTQYTPWFNDGDPCVFHTHDIDYTFDGTEYESYDDPGKKWDRVGQKYVSVQIPAPLSAAYLAIKELYAQFSSAEEVMQQVFGDHVRVTATRDGISVDEYEHD
jgi:hypothetical protein